MKNSRQQHPDSGEISTFNTKIGRFGFMAWGLVFLWSLALGICSFQSRAQQPPLSHAQDFSTDMYFKPPNEQLVETRLSGTNALPLPGGLLDVKKLKIETFSTNGTLQMTALADQCTYDIRHGMASSPGHLDLVSGDGVYHLDGDGFMFVWGTNATSLTVSNHCRTVIRNGMLKL